MVLIVHGGPWARDIFGYRGGHQWLVDRGYAVLSVNYRGPTGFGKAFIAASEKEYARKIHDDLMDMVEWAIEQGIAQRDKIAIVGMSYGGAQDRHSGSSTRLCLNHKNTTPPARIASQTSESRKYSVGRFIAPHFHPVGAKIKPSLGVLRCLDLDQAVGRCPIGPQN